MKSKTCIIRRPVLSSIHPHLKSKYKNINCCWNNTTSDHDISLMIDIPGKEIVTKLSV